ncbi:hypothetical protein AAVH_29010 [Aphelenchoides avenae]|nr:hypothetical protein AAVH_29010 [Aphelenchus avenae]
MNVQLPDFQGLAFDAHTNLHILLEFPGVAAMFVPVADAQRDYPALLDDLIARVTDDFYSIMLGVAMVQAGGNQIAGEDFPVEHIVGARYEGGHLQLAVKWANYENATWEAAANCVEADAAFAAFVEMVMEQL